MNTISTFTPMPSSGAALLGRPRMSYLRAGLAFMGAPALQPVGLAHAAATSKTDIANDVAGSSPRGGPV